MSRSTWSDSAPLAHGGGHGWIAALSAIVVMVIAAVLSMPSAVRACGGTPPPPPAFCNYGYAFGKAVPRVVVCAPGSFVVVPISTFHFVQVFGNACPPPPFTVTMSVTLNCVPPPSAGPIVVGPFPVANGFNFIPIGIAVPCTPPRRCLLSVVSTVAFANGRTVSLTGDVEVCIVEESPGMPGVPRLDLQVLGPDTVGAHAGDQASVWYRLTNNDPIESWTGTLSADFRNTAKQPVEGGLLGPIREASALADPGPGDNWPIDFGFNIPPGGSIPLPPDPQNQVVSAVTSSVLTLMPGESRDLEVVTRSWGMCAHGSCGESGLEADGGFSDLTEGIACASAMYYVDNSIPPTFQWNDGGSVPIIQPVPGPVVQAIHHPRPAEFIPLQMVLQPVLVGQFPIPPQPAFTQSGVQDLGPWRGRLNSQLGPPAGGGVWQVDSFFDITYEIDFIGPGSDPFIGLAAQVVPGAPDGFEHLAPLAMGSTGVDHDGNNSVDSFFDIFYQVNGVAQTDVGPVPIEIVALNLVSVGPSTIQVNAQARVPSTSGALEVFDVELMTDLGGYSRPTAPNPCIGDINGDGFTNAGDFVILAGNFGSAVPPNTGGDLNGDGLVNAADFVILAGDFGCAP